jgi:beta-glucosidase-like glycosyl hydrolase
MGGLFVTGFRGTKAGDLEVDKVRRMLQAGNCAGVILMRRNCTSPEQVSRLSVVFREAASELPPVISVNAIRTILGFDGAIFTDDLEMAAFEKAMPFDAAVIAAVTAGNTFLIYSNYRKGDTIEMVGRALDALQSNTALLDPVAVSAQNASADAFRQAIRQPSNVVLGSPCRSLSFPGRSAADTSTKGRSRIDLSTRV